MPCPDLGALRASIDDPGGAPAPVHDHARGCAACSDTLAELQRNAELAAPAIALTAPDDPPAAAEVEAALARLEQRRARLAAARTVPAGRPGRAAAGPPAPGHRTPTPPPRSRWPGVAGWPGWGPGPAGWRRPWSRPWC